MYTITIRHEGAPAKRTSNHTADDVREAAYDLVRTAGSTISSRDEAGLNNLISKACAVADADNFAALEFGKSWMTIRPDA